MSIRVALRHKTSYKYDRLVTLYPQVVRLRPAPHCRTPIHAYSLKIGPKTHFINWQQDPYSNYLARLVFPEQTKEFVVEIDLVADMTVINPFDFFVEEYAEKFPFTYDKSLAKELIPFLETLPITPKLRAWLDAFVVPGTDLTGPELLAASRKAEPGDRTLRPIDLVVGLNQRVQESLQYIIRMEPGVQSPEETLELGKGSCRDFAWLLVQVLRHFGLAARFVSGYSIQLVADIKALDGPSGASVDCCDLHAWAEVYLPGAGWVGLDATCGLLTGSGYIPLAATAEPSSAAPISGAFNYDKKDPKDEIETDFKVEMSVHRVHEDPRVTKPYTEEQWAEIEALGHTIDAQIKADDIRLTMGGEPTFVSIDDMEGAEWNTTAVGPNKRKLAGDLLRRLHDKFSSGGLLHFGQGKWYPGEQLPRWALSCWWRRDGIPIWQDHDLIAVEKTNYGFNETHAEQFAHELTERLGVDSKYLIPGYEDVWHYLLRERRFPVNVDPFDSKLEDPLERARVAKIFDQGLKKTIGFALPIRRDFGRWATGPWFWRRERMYLIPGDSPMGYRLPLDSLPWMPPEEYRIYERDPLESLSGLPPRNLSQRHIAGVPEAFGPSTGPFGPLDDPRAHRRAQLLADGTVPGTSDGRRGTGDEKLPNREEQAAIRKKLLEQKKAAADRAKWEPYAGLVRTAMTIEARDNHLYVFMPPQRYTEDYLDLLATIEETAGALQMPVFIEGYEPPRDPRLNHFRITPDPGVIEVNLHPAHSWDEMVSMTTTLYEEARQCRLGTEKFMVDGRHTGTGGGNHIVIGGATPADSPILRRPDVLKSLIGFWHNHPSLSYLFSGLFIGPTSQAPRVDEARNDSLYELELAFRNIPDPSGTFTTSYPANCPPWKVDRTLRNMLIDVTGNTHRSEFCIDKLYSPDGTAGRLGLVEMRAFEMPPHARMSLTQQLLLRSLLARFWRAPYNEKLVRWGTELHDRFMLPHFVREDFQDVMDDLYRDGYPMKAEWFEPHFEFRFPVHGTVAQRGIHMELRQAIEPWHVLGEDVAVGGTVRYVDSSVERVQVKLEGMVDPRHVITCNGRRVPLHPTGTNGQYVAGVRYKAWNPPSSLHPSIYPQSPLIFDVLDTWNKRSVGGCQYHVAHPGGLSYVTFPVNAYEAESRRVNRFFQFGHTQGSMPVPAEEPNREFPFTLDLRR